MEPGRPGCSDRSDPGPGRRPFRHGPDVTSAADEGTQWWRHAVLYQIYPRSFADSDGDGTGDLPGIIDRLDHLEWLGVDGIWLSPVTVSPNADWGYDVADYLAIQPDLGTSKDLDHLIAEARRRGIRVLLDLVPNHTSEQHEWFIDSRTSRHARHREWYVWADPKPDGSPPNNWVSGFGGPAWTLDEHHRAVLPAQPPRRAARPQLVERGGAGRVRPHHPLLVGARCCRASGSTCATSSSRTRCCATTLRPPSPIRSTSSCSGSVRSTTATAPRCTRSSGAGDGWSMTFPAPCWWGRRRSSRSRPWPPTTETDATSSIWPSTSPSSTRRWTSVAMRTIVEATEAALPAGAWPVWTGSNHDMSRFSPRWADDDPARARVALVILLCLRGTPVLYQGDEIGLGDTEPQQADLRDPLGVRFWPYYAGRDGMRTPMPWRNVPGGGFTDPGVRALAALRRPGRLQRRGPVRRSGVDAPPGSRPHLPAAGHPGPAGRLLPVTPRRRRVRGPGTAGTGWWWRPT